MGPRSIIIFLNLSFVIEKNVSYQEVFLECWYIIVFRILKNNYKYVAHANFNHDSQNINFEF